MADDMTATPNNRLACRSMDRRTVSFHSLTYGAIVHGRRRGSRRRGDSLGNYVDRYDAHLFVVAIGIFLLCCLDAHFTLILLDRGAEEINPLMAALLNHGVQTFVYTKLTITGFGLIFLVVHAAFWIAGTVRVSDILYAVLLSYVLLFVYQLQMLAQAL